MAYIVVKSAEGQELDRRELSGLVIVGRSPDSDLRIRDIMLSREHCGLEEADGGWVVVDLDSRNGTFVNGERVSRRKLEDGDVLKAGQTHIEFHLGPMPASPRKTGLLERPADPFEAMASTMVGYTFDPKFEPPVERPIVRPRPRPMPVQNKTPGATMAAQLAAGDQQLASSATWAVKPMEQLPAMRDVLECLLPEPVPQAQPAAISTPAGADPEPAPATRAWCRRVGLMVGEALATAALAGTLLLVVLTALS